MTKPGTFVGFVTAVMKEGNQFERVDYKDLKPKQQKVLLACTQYR